MESKHDNLGITVKKSEDMSEWYQQVVLKGELADYSPVKGCMIIRPHGYALWEAIQSYFDARIKAIGVKNAYFPLFIPEHFFTKEAEHAEGFAPEVAWIANTEEGVRLAVRPTSETIMCDSFAKWVRSHRDLPLRINQWVNVVRWETKATRLFLRTREFLWQEGHCLYATKKDADKETLLMLKEYARLAEKLLAIPVIMGKKTDAEKFAGALYTTTIEALMPDGKALQCGTSHNLGQGFVKAFGISFLDEQGQTQTPWHTSWGISTRLIGGLTMMHGDDKGLVLPPRIAPIQVAIVPILFDDTRDAVLAETKKIVKLIGKKYRTVNDTREEHSAGFKFNEWELKGVPFRIEVGPKDIAKQQVVVVRRDTKQKSFVPLADLLKHLRTASEQMHQDMYLKAKQHLDASTVRADTKDALKQAIGEKKLALVPHCGAVACEKLIKEETQATSRCIPLRGEKPTGSCVWCENKAQYMVYMARNY